MTNPKIIQPPTPSVHSRYRRKWRDILCDFFSPSLVQEQIDFLDRVGFWSLTDVKNKKDRMKATEYKTMVYRCNNCQEEFEEPFTGDHMQDDWAPCPHCREMSEPQRIVIHLGREQ